MSIFGLDRVFKPSKIAIVGGSPRPSSLGLIILLNIVNGGFAGDIAVVNPRHASIGGRRTYYDLKAVPFVPDLVVITAPASTITDIVATAGQRGVAGVVIISSGLGRGAGSTTEAIAQTARAHNIRIVGPNSLGIMFPASVSMRALRRAIPRRARWP
jgi:acetyltransferase